jgi:hypothetical protein
MSATGAISRRMCLLNSAELQIVTKPGFRAANSVMNAIDAGIRKPYRDVGHPATSATALPPRVPARKTHRSARSKWGVSRGTPRQERSHDATWIIL